MSYFASIKQAAIVDTNNSFAGTINTGTTWNSSGTGTASLNFNSIQIQVSADQPLIIFIDQGRANNTFEVTDQYNYIVEAEHNFGVTVQVTGAYVRVRAANFSGTNATAVTVDTLLRPIADPLPRSLDENQNLKVTMGQDGYGFDAENTPMGEQRIAVTYFLVGKQFEFFGGNSSLPDSNFWSNYTLNSASLVVANSQVTLTSGTNSAAAVSLYSTRKARYVTGNSNRLRVHIKLGDTGIANNIRRWGISQIANYTFVVSLGTPTIGNFYTNNSQQFICLYINGTTIYCSGTGAPSAGTQTLTFIQGPGSGNLTTTSNATAAFITDGAYVKLSGTTLSMCTARGGVETAVANGVFNGNFGGSYTLTTTDTIWEIYYNTGKVYFVIDDEILHTANFPNTTWTNSPSLTCFIDNINSGNTTSVTLTSRGMTIARFGSESSSPKWYYFHGVQSGIILKTGPGRLKRVIINGQANGSNISLYDSITTINQIALIAHSANNLATPIFAEYDLDFYNGLYLVTAGASTDVTIIYE